MSGDKGWQPQCFEPGDGDHCCLTDFVVMPSHVHVLAAFASEEAMLKQCESWKHFTAREINRALGRSGRFWEQDAFDHLVRSRDEFAQLRRYLAENPRAARLSAGQYIHYCRAEDAAHTFHGA